MRSIDFVSFNYEEQEEKLIHQKLAILDTGEPDSIFSTAPKHQLTSHYDKMPARWSSSTNRSGVSERINHLGNSIASLL